MLSPVHQRQHRQQQRATAATAATAAKQFPTMTSTEELTSTEG